MGGQELERLRAAYARRPENDPRYSPDDPAYRLALGERERGTLAILARNGLSPLSGRDILDLGCGTGVWLRDLVRWGATPSRLVGVDPLAPRIGQARESVDSAIRLEVADGSTLPFSAGSFDLVLISLVVSSIADPAVAAQVTAEAKRVLRSGGMVLWYDFFVDNPRNRDVHGVSRAEIARLFPGAIIELQRITLAPPIARAVAGWSMPLARALGAIPLLRTHYLGVIRP